MSEEKHQLLFDEKVLANKSHFKKPSCPNDRTEWGEIFHLLTLSQVCTNLRPICRDLQTNTQRTQLKLGGMEDLREGIKNKLLRQKEGMKTHRQR